jgi:hypothetical protein
LEGEGHTITSSWLHEDASATKQQCCLTDIADIDAADVLVFFAHQHGSTTGRGKYLELGYAIGTNKPIVIIGSSLALKDQCVFYHHPDITWVEGYAELLRYMLIVVNK